MDADGLWMKPVVRMIQYGQSVHAVINVAVHGGPDWFRVISCYPVFTLARQKLCGRTIGIRVDLIPGPASPDPESAIVIIK